MLWGLISKNIEALNRWKHKDAVCDENADTIPEQEAFTPFLNQVMLLAAYVSSEACTISKSSVDDQRLTTTKLLCSICKINKVNQARENIF